LQAQIPTVSLSFRQQIPGNHLSSIANRDSTSLIGRKFFRNAADTCKPLQVTNRKPARIPAPTGRTHSIATSAIGSGPDSEQETP
jgi:hypothetical protein